MPRLGQVGRKPQLPPNLLTGPFTLQVAEQAGLTRGHLRGASWKRVGPATYASRRLDDDPMYELEAAQFRLPESAAFSGLTAGWLHGLDVAPCSPIEATVENDAGVSARAGLHIRRATLGAGDVIDVRGMRVTSIERTVADIAARLSLTEAVVVTDAALHAGLTRLEDLTAWARAHPGRRGIRRMRRVLEMADASSESPMESRLRMVLVMGGLPRPASQVEIHDGDGRFVARIDLFYASQRLGIEYDGDVHRNAMTSDHRRQNRLLSAGVRLLRFTAPDVISNPAGVVMQVRTMLAA